MAPKMARGTAMPAKRAGWAFMTQEINQMSVNLNDESQNCDRKTGYNFDMKHYSQSMPLYADQQTKGIVWRDDGLIVLERDFRVSFQQRFIDCGQ
jgi:hypothetical protein